jgi:hypothetical protein
MRIPKLIEKPTRITAAGKKPKLDRAGPDDGVRGAEYVGVCVPSFSPETVHREGG